MVGTEDQWGLCRKHSERGLRKWNGSNQIKHRLAIGAAANCTIPGFINILTKLMVVECVGYSDIAHGTAVHTGCRPRQSIPS